MRCALPAVGGPLVSPTSAPPTTTAQPPKQQSCSATSLPSKLAPHPLHRHPFPLHVADALRASGGWRTAGQPHLRSSHNHRPTTETTKLFRYVPPQQTCSTPPTPSSFPSPRSGCAARFRRLADRWSAPPPLLPQPPPNHRNNKVVPLRSSPAPPLKRQMDDRRVRVGIAARWEATAAATLSGWVPPPRGSIALSGLLRTAR